MAAEKIKKNTLQRLQPKNPRSRKIIELKTTNPELSTTQIGKLVDCSHVNVVRVLQRYGMAQQEVNDYKTNRADILAGLQHRLISSITDEDIKKTPVGSRILAACQIYDKERLERGQSTANIANNHSISESLQESIDKIIGRSVEAKQPVDNPVYNYDKSQVIEITQDNASD